MLSVALVVSVMVGAVSHPELVAATHGRTIVMLAPTSSATAANEAADVVKSHLSDTDTTLNVAWVDDFDVGSERAFRLAEDVANKQHADVVFWTDYQNPRVLLWYWRDGAVGRLFVQSLGDEGMSRQGRTEALGLAVHSAAGSTSAFVGLGPAVREVPAPVVSAAAVMPPAPADEHRLRLGLAVGGTGFAKEQAVAPIIDISFAVALTTHFDAVLTGRWMLPPSIESSFGKLTLRTYSARLGLQHSWQDGDTSFALGGAAAVGYRGWTFAGTGIDQSGSSRVLAGISPFASAGYRLSQRWRALITVGADVWVNEKRYGITTAAGNQVISGPWWVAPWLQVAATVDFL
jgi:hypothetical protein